MNDALKKLQYKGQSPVLAIGVPDEAASLISAIEAQGGEVHRKPNGAYAYPLVFATSMAEANERAPRAAEALEGDALLWLCYPKGTSKRYPKQDINRDTSWQILETAGMRPVSQVALDNDWSAMRFRRSEYVKK